MGSNGASVGNQAGKLVATFTAAGQNTGQAGIQPGTSVTTGLGWIEVPPFYKARTFQLVPVGAGHNFSITLYGTLVQSTSEGTTAFWEPIPGPSTETSPQWSNPLTDVAGQRLFYCNAPLSAVYAVSANGPGGAWSGSCQLYMLSAS